MNVKKKLANHEIVTLAVYLLGGDAQRVDTEDIAVKANEVAPGRFTWRKYPDQTEVEEFEGQTPVELISKGETGRLWASLFYLRSGMPD